MRIGVLGVLATCLLALVPAGQARTTSCPDTPARDRWVCVDAQIRATYDWRTEKLTMSWTNPRLPGYTLKIVQVLRANGVGADGGVDNSSSSVPYSSDLDEFATSGTFTTLPPTGAKLYVAIDYLRVPDEVRSVDFVESFAAEVTIVNRPGGSKPEGSRPKNVSLHVPNMPHAYVGEKYAFPLCRKGYHRSSPGLPRNRLCGPPWNPGTAPYTPRGGTPPYTFKQYVGKPCGQCSKRHFLPKGLVLNHNTGWIEGTPQPGTEKLRGQYGIAGAYLIEICARDALGEEYCDPADLNVYPRRR